MTVPIHLSVSVRRCLRIMLIVLITLLAHAAAARAETLPSCTSLRPDPTAANPALIVVVNPATAWQPRAGEVLVEIHGDPAMLSSLRVRACLGWSGGELSHEREAVVRMRPSDVSGTSNFGITVPELPAAPGNWPARLFTGTPPSIGLGIVPLAGLRLIIGNQQGFLADLVQPVGITSLWYASIITVAVVLAALAILQGLARRRGTPGTLLLRLIVTREGIASLSQLQVLIWTLVVGASVVYVMSLSGNLINVTSGTLVLLGIAGAAGILSGFALPRAVNLDPTPAMAIAPADPAASVAQRRSSLVEPSWSDLVAINGSAGTDMTRVQMLFFTLVTAVFVLMKVLTNYVIPDIPDGYLLLMGISNGIYLGGKLNTARS